MKITWGHITTIKQKSLFLQNGARGLWFRWYYEKVMLRSFLCYLDCFRTQKILYEVHKGLIQNPSKYHIKVYHIATVFRIIDLKMLRKTLPICVLLRSNIISWNGVSSKNPREINCLYYINISYAHTIIQKRKIICISWKLPEIHFIKLSVHISQLFWMKTTSLYIKENLCQNILFNSKTT